MQEQPQIKKGQIWELKEFEGYRVIVLDVTDTHVKVKAISIGTAEGQDWAELDEEFRVNITSFLEIYDLISEEVVTPKQTIPKDLALKVYLDHDNNTDFDTIKQVFSLRKPDKLLVTFNPKDLLFTVGTAEQGRGSLTILVKAEQISEFFNLCTQEGIALC